MQNENVHFFLWADSETRDQKSLKTDTINKLYKEKFINSEEFNYEIKIKVFKEFFFKL